MVTSLAACVVTCQTGDVIHEFPCGTRPLDFAATLRARRESEPYEFLRMPGDLDDWLSQSGLRSGGALATGGDFADAIELREAVYTLAWHRMHGEPLPPAPLAVVNAAAAVAPVAPRLDADGVVREGSVAACLADLAREAVDLFGGPDVGLLRECSRPECTQVYLDRSRGHRREWCSMQSCGNRAKAAAYRARRREAASEVS